MEPMKRININSHFELIPAEKLKEYGGRIVQIGHAIKGLQASVSFLCEVQAEMETIVSLPCYMKPGEVIKAQKQVMNPTVFNLEDILGED